MASHDEFGLLAVGVLFGAMGGMMFAVAATEIREGRGARAAGAHIAERFPGKRWDEVDCQDHRGYPRRVCTVRVWDTDTTSTIRLVEVTK